MIRRRSMLLTVTVLLCIVAGSLRYYTLVTQTVYEESVSHLRAPASDWYRAERVCGAQHDLSAHVVDLDTGDK